MNRRTPMTSEGYARLKEELKRLKEIERPAVIRAIAEAREHGDLSENAEYHAAREKQSFIEGRVKELGEKIGTAEIIDIDALSGDRVTFGATVTLSHGDDDDATTYRIVGADEADIAAGRLSVQAPLARALINRRRGESVEVTTPSGRRAYTIVDVRFGEETRS